MAPPGRHSSDQSNRGVTVTGGRKVAVVTGANRGLGLETCRQLGMLGYAVVLTSRDRDQGSAATRRLHDQGLAVTYQQLDVTRPETVRQVARAVGERFARLDALVNNAGVMLEHRDPHRPGTATALAGDIELVRATLEVNLLGTMAVTQALVPLMGGDGRVVNVSSGMGQLTEMGGNWPGYRISKTALNALTRMLAAELADTRIKVNSVCPGWVRTDMGGPNAPRALEQGVDTIVWAATLPEDGPTGGFFRDRQPIPW